jgi:CheY-like chemotaxis protein
MTVIADVDGASPVEQAQHLRPDVVLADIRMPRVDGLEVTRILAGRQAGDPLRAIVVMSFDLDEYIRAAWRNGSCGFLLKHSGSALLADAVRAAMGGDALISPQVTVRLLRHLSVVPAQPVVQQSAGKRSPHANRKSPAWSTGPRQRRDRGRTLHHRRYGEEPPRRHPAPTRRTQPGGHRGIGLTPASSVHERPVPTWFPPAQRRCHLKSR